MNPGEEIAAEFAEGLREAAADTGDGIGTAFLLYIDPNLGPRTPSDPTPFPEPTRTAIIVLDDGIKQHYGDGGVVLREVHTMTVAATGPVPAPRDRIELGGRTFGIVKVEPYAPGGLPLFYDVELAS